MGADRNVRVTGRTLPGIPLARLQFQRFQQGLVYPTCDFETLLFLIRADRGSGYGPEPAIYRPGMIAERLKLPNAPDLASLAMELGYADQSHFTRDFTKMVGRSPVTFHQREAG